MLRRLLIIIWFVDTASLERLIWKVINFMFVFVWKQTFLVSLKAISKHLPERAEKRSSDVSFISKRIGVNGLNYSKNYM